MNKPLSGPSKPPGQTQAPANSGEVAKTGTRSAPLHFELHRKQKKQREQLRGVRSVVEAEIPRTAA
jgi:hypothetical protein